MNGARRNAQGAATLQLILDETVKLLRRHGYDNTTITRITRATRRPASSIYWLFETKDELLAAALESTYQNSSGGHAAWQFFAPDRPLLDQLLGELEPEFRVAESETSVRLGIMLALEGSAGTSTIQEPFRRRRAMAQERLAAWWSAAFDAQDGASVGAGVRSMAGLTIAFLDGHYVSDLSATEDDAARRSSVVAHALAGAHAAMAAGTLLRPVPDPAGHRSSVANDGAGTEDPMSDALLRATRSLVAERGYEGATLGRISQLSGVQRSSLYWRYKDKEALIHAAVADPLLDLLGPLRTLPAPGSGWLDDLTGAVRRILTAVQADPDTVRAGLLLKLQRWDPPTVAGSAILAGFEQGEGDLASWFARIPPLRGQQGTVGSDLAWTVWRMVEGFMLGASLGPALDADEVSRLVAPMLTEAVGSVPAGM